MRPAFVYIVSNVSHTLYCGITTDLAERFAQHKSGTYPNGFTARYHFDRLVYYEAAASMNAAAQREQEIKKWRRSKRVALIQSMNPNWLDLSSRLDPLASLR